VTVRAGPSSLAAERAVRLLRSRGSRLGSVDLAREVLATRAADERTARLVLESAFCGDRRLLYFDGVWDLAGAGPTAERERREPDPDRVLLAVTVERSAANRGRRRLRTVSAARLRGARVVATCAGEVDGPGNEQLRGALVQLLDSAVLVVHDPPGALRMLERWLDVPLVAPVSLRELGRGRLGLRATHDLGSLLGRLQVRWRDTANPLDVAAALDAALSGLRRRGEPLAALRLRDESMDRSALDATRFAFDEEFLRRVPHTPGTYRFYDAEGGLLYVGRSKDLARRLASYFHARPSARVRRLLDKLWRIEYEPLGSDLEAMLREAARIRRDRPSANVQREVHWRGRRLSLRSLAIVEPAEEPSALRVYLVRNARLVARVAVGRRGGGLARIRGVLEERFFGERPDAGGLDLDAEIVARWLSTHDRVVVFDPTDLPSADDVVARLRTLARRRVLVDVEGPPRFRR